MDDAVPSMAEVYEVFQRLTPRQAVVLRALVSAGADTDGFLRPRHVGHGASAVLQQLERKGLAEMPPLMRHPCATCSYRATALGVAVADRI